MYKFKKIKKILEHTQCSKRSTIIYSHRTRTRKTETDNNKKPTILSEL